MKTIKIKYFTEKIEKLTYIGGKSDWIDLRAAESVDMKAGEFRLIPLGVAMELPEGYEAHIVPRSSTFKNFGIIQTNHQGVIDCSYCGDNDQWFMPAYAFRDTHIEINDRIWRQEGEMIYGVALSVFEDDIWGIYFQYPVDSEEGWGRRIIAIADTLKGTN